MFMNDHHGDGRLAIWCNADRDAQVALVDADPRRFFVRPGHTRRTVVKLTRRGRRFVRLHAPVRVRAEATTKRTEPPYSSRSGIYAGDVVLFRPRHHRH